MRFRVEGFLTKDHGSKATVSICGRDSHHHRSWLGKIARVQNGTGTGQARVTVTYYSRDEDVSNANHAFWMRTLLCEAKSSTRA